MMTHERRHSSHDFITLVLGGVLHHLASGTECLVMIG